MYPPCLMITTFPEPGIENTLLTSPSKTERTREPFVHVMSTPLLTVETPGKVG